jgi:hypothetical protein
MQVDNVIPSWQLRVPNIDLLFRLFASDKIVEHPPYQAECVHLVVVFPTGNRNRTSKLFVAVGSGGRETGALDGVNFPAIGKFAPI